MTRRETVSRNEGSAYVSRAKDGNLVLRLGELSWETEFFGRRFGRLEIEAQDIHGVDAAELEQALKDTLSFGDQDGFDVIELQLDMSWLHQMHLFEDNGFRLVDTKAHFFTWKTKAEMESVPEPTGEVVFASEEMKEEILCLTRRSFTDNAFFKSRFNNERFFSQADTERYYSAWIERYLSDENTLFAVMRDEGKIVGYLIYTKTGEHRGKPVYRAALIAVAPECRGRGIYFDLRSFVYRHLPESGAYLDATTQLSNLSTIRNFIKTRKVLDSVRLIFYRPREGRIQTEDGLC
jgi:ribosomal protein S18 acetylase RimI-like enzyme